jgi:preprotein translocase subunit SecY
MAGIVAQMPTFIANLFEGGRSGSISPFIIVGCRPASGLGMVLFICFMERAQRRLLIQYPKRQTQRGMMQADRSHLPLKLNTAGVIPPIFASSLLLLPLTITQFAGNSLPRKRQLGRVRGWRSTSTCARQAGLHAALCGGHHLLLLLLHRGRLQSRGNGRESEEERRLHSGHPSGQEHRRTISTMC